MKYVKIFITGILLISAGAAAQDGFEELTIPDGVDSSYTIITFQADAYHFNNDDFEDYNAKTYEKNKAVASENTDDAVNFAISTIKLDVHKKVSKSEFDLVMDRTGFWGNDNLMGKDQGGNPFRFLSMHCKVYPVDFYELTIGRFEYGIGSAKYDYFFEDIVDGVENRFIIPLGIDSLKISLLTEIMSNAAKPSDTYAWSALEKDSEEIDDFDGDTVSLRHGLSVSYYAATLFGYYVRYGANTSGAADTSEDGKSSLNEADHDYLFMGGLRAFYTAIGAVSTDATFAYSTGKDYQYEGGRDYDGYAGSLNIAVDMSGTGLNLPVLEEFVTSTGYFSPKFCGMKADSPGGMITYLYKGYFVAPYANFYHFKDYAKDEYEVSTVDKTVSKTFIKNSLTTNVAGITSSVSSVVFFANEDKDIKVSNVAGKNTKGEDGLTYMGTEVDTEISYTIDQLELYIIGGVYLPSDYYSEKSKVNTYFTDGSDMMYGVNLGCTYNFGM